MAVTYCCHVIWRTDMSTNVKAVLFQHKSLNSLAQSFLFHCALHYSQHGRRVVYISSSRIEKLPGGINQKDDTPDPTAFIRIRFLYIDTLPKLVEALLGIHSQQVPPTVIVLEQFEWYASNGRDANTLSALLLRTAHVVNTKTGASTFVFTSDAKPRPQAFIHFSAIWSIINSGEQVTLVNELSNFTKKSPAAFLFLKSTGDSLQLKKVMKRSTINLDSVSGDTEIDFF